MQVVPGVIRIRPQHGWRRLGWRRPGWLGPIGVAARGPPSAARGILVGKAKQCCFTKASTIINISNAHQISDNMWSFRLCLLSLGHPMQPSCCVPSVYTTNTRPCYNIASLECTMRKQNNSMETVQCSYVQLYRSSPHNRGSIALL